MQITSIRKGQELASTQTSIGCAHVRHTRATASPGHSAGLRRFHPMLVAGLLASMEDMQNLEILVLDTLYDRWQSKSDGCMVVNKAGMELLKSGREVLPLIESAILNLVVPKAKGRSERITGLFLGITYVFGAYLLISCKENYDAAISFLRQLPENLLEDALHALHSFLRKRHGVYNFGVAPSEWLLSYLRELAQSPNPEFRSSATIYLEEVLK